MKSKIKSRMAPVPYRPKFQPGQRVRISDTGIDWQIAKPGTMGTVEQCGLVVTVLMDGTQSSQRYAPDFWDAYEDPSKGMKSRG